MNAINLASLPLTRLMSMRMDAREKYYDWSQTPDDAAAKAVDDELAAINAEIHRRIAANGGSAAAALRAEKTA